MSTWVAITWENDRLLFLSASTYGKAVTFDHAAALDDPKKLADLLSQHRLAKAETVVILNRSDVEVRSMVFPPVPADELPALVKFQAGKEFNHYDPNAPVDFFVTSKLNNVSRSTLFPAVKTSGSSSAPEGAPKHLLASTLRLHTFQRIKTFCEEHNLVLRHVGLRSCAVAALWKQSGNYVANRSVLLVELDKYETSQTVVFQGEPVFMRSPKIHRPQDVSTPDFAARLLAELKRTRIAVRNEIQGTDVDEVLLCGSGNMFVSLAEQLTKELGMPVRLFDPMKGLSVKANEADERYASLFGAIIQAARKEPMQIDFCNPKKRAEDHGKRNLFTGIAAVVLLLVVSLFGYAFHSHSVVKSDIAKLTRTHNELKKTAGDVVEWKKQLDAIDAWYKDNVNWFEQLGWMSKNAPRAEDMMARELMFSSANGGTITFVSLLRDQDLLAPMVDQFRDTEHALRTLGRGPNNDPRYTFRSELSISLSKDAVAADLSTQQPQTTPE